MSLRALAGALARVALSGLTGGAVFSVWLKVLLSNWTWGIEAVAAREWRKAAAGSP